MRVRSSLILVDNSGRKRTTPFKLIDRLGHTIRRSLDLTLGQTVDEELVEIVDLNSPTATDEDVLFACNCHAAHRELILSKHFPSWMGYSKDRKLYFEHFTDAQCLGVLIEKYGVLIEPQPLLYSIISQVLVALRDILEQCTFEILSPLSLNNVFLVNNGTKVILGGIHWGEKYSLLQATSSNAQYVKWHRNREQKLVCDFGNMLREIIGISSSGVELFHGKQQGETSDLCYTFSRAECDSGFRIAVGSKFRVNLSGSDTGKKWKIEKIGDAGTGARELLSSTLSPTKRALRSAVLEVESPDTLEFRAIQPGQCRILFKEMEWWQHSAQPNLTKSKHTRQTRPDASFTCKVSVIKPHDKADRMPCSPGFMAVISACTFSNGEVYEGQIRLNDLQETYDMFQHADNTDEFELIDDYNIFLGKHKLG